MKPVLYIIIPCYNEEQVLPVTCEMFLNKIVSLVEKGKISDNSRVLFVNDGSRDRTWEIITELSVRDRHYIGISQSRNRGHQNAVLAGLGFFLAVASLVGIVWAIVQALTGHTVGGWASLICIVCFIGGVQLLCLGVIGEYIGKIYLETKARPRYIISERTYESEGNGGDGKMNSRGERV